MEVNGTKIIARQTFMSCLIHKNVEAKILNEISAACKLHSNQIACKHLTITDMKILYTALFSESKQHSWSYIYALMELHCISWFRSVPLHYHCLWCQNMFKECICLDPSQVGIIFHCACKKYLPRKKLNSLRSDAGFRFFGVLSMNRLGGAMTEEKNTSDLRL